MSRGLQRSCRAPVANTCQYPRTRGIVATVKHEPIQSQMKVDRREQRLQQKFSRWAEIRLRLQHSWGPDKVLAWYRERFPGEPAPLSRALTKEREFADTRTPLLPEVRENIALLARMYHDHFRTCQESGLEPKATQNVKVEQSGEVFHQTFPFLKAEEAARLKKTQEDVDAGRIDVLELYRAASGSGRRKRERARAKLTSWMRNPICVASPRSVAFRNTSWRVSTSTSVIAA